MLLDKVNYTASQSIPSKLNKLNATPVRITTENFYGSRQDNSKIPLKKIYKNSQENYENKD